eukprot:TRINITY_DN2394_c1_g1_i3.p1 TRINITY_DN2394_c1_g1~~TRINITY_DN2394_c1_g1_i3.p1  ORF type:complete len:454 (-),score=93.15 TRINITY_DN2394_c1_g1_i3:54-1415(-)
MACEAKTLMDAMQNYQHFCNGKDPNQQSRKLPKLLPSSPRGDGSPRGSHSGRLPKHVTLLAQAPPISTRPEKEPFGKKTYSTLGIKAINGSGPMILRIDEEVDEQDSIRDEERSRRVHDFVERRQATCVENRRKAQRWQRRKRKLEEVKKMTGPESKDVHEVAEEIEVDLDVDEFQAIAEEHRRRMERIRRTKLRGMAARLKERLLYGFEANAVGKTRERRPSVLDTKSDSSEDEQDAAGQAKFDPHASPFETCMILSRKHRCHLQYVRQCYEEFASYDLDASGRLSFEEFRERLRARCGYKDSEEVPPRLLDNIFARIDCNNDSSIDFEEYLLWSMSSKFSEEILVPSPEARSMRQLSRDLDVPIPEIERLKRIFELFDTNGNGFIDKEEFEEVILKLLKVKDRTDLSQGTVSRYWRECDWDNVGQVDFLGFLLWHLRMDFVADEGRWKKYS